MPARPPQRFRHAAIVGKPQAQGMRGLLDDVAQFLSREGLEVSVERATALATGLAGYDALDPPQLGRQCDVAVVVGGDGTMLGIGRELARYDVPLVGINQGRLGFITDIPIQNMLPALGEILAGRSRLENRTLLEARVMRDGEQIFCSVAVNDVVVARGTGAGMVELKLTVDGEFMYNQRSDGLIVSTPTGSTAYSLSAGGPLLHPSLQGIVLVPIAPHALSNRPIVVPDTSEIVVELVSGRDISVNFDMQTFTSAQLGDRIVISRSPHTVTFLHPLDWSYYHTLREKLHWNEYPSSDGKLK
jgi:NAD+ kinase